MNHMIHPKFREGVRQYNHRVIELDLPKKGKLKSFNFFTIAIECIKSAIGGIITCGLNISKLLFEDQN